MLEDGPSGISLRRVLYLEREGRLSNEWLGGSIEDEAMCHYSTIRGLSDDEGFSMIGRKMKRAMIESQGTSKRADQHS
jgi:hypothetical protein